MRVWSPGREDPLEEETATHSSLLAWKNSTDRGTSWTTVHRVPKSEAWQSTHTCTIYRTLSYYFTINTTHTNPTQWVMILQLREVEGFTTIREKPRLQPPHLVAFFASISAEGRAGWARRQLIPSFPSPPTILLSPAEAWTEVRLASCWVMRRFTGLIKEAKKYVSDFG